MDIRPLYDRIVVKRIRGRRENRPVGCSFPIPPKKSRRKAKSSPWETASVATTGKLIPLDVKPGDRILFGKYSGSDIKMDGEEFMIMREDEVLGVLEGAAKRRRLKSL